MIHSDLSREGLIPYLGMRVFRNPRFWILHLISWGQWQSKMFHNYMQTIKCSIQGTVLVTVNHQAFYYNMIYVYSTKLYIENIREK